MSWIPPRFTEIGLLLILILPGASFASPASEGTGETMPIWSQWRGPTRDGQSPPAKWPLNLENLSESWSVKLGPSYSGPIVLRDRVLITETVNEEDEVVRAFSRSSGKELWSSDWKGAMSVPFFARANGSWIRSTPTYDDGRLYIGGIRDYLVCIDAKTGEKIWAVDFVEQLKTSLPSFGLVCSPLVTADSLFIQAGSSLSKLDKKTGKILWMSLKDSGAGMGSAFSSPILSTLCGRLQLVVQTRERLAGVDANTGDVLWEKDIPSFRGMNILTPIIWNNFVFTSSYGGGSFLLEINEKDDGFSVTEAWTDRSQAYMSSPVVVGDHLYMHLRNQRITCIDLKSGDRTWTTSQRFGKYMSMVTQGEQILALDEGGELFLFDANPEEFTVLDQRQVAKTESWAHLALVKDEIFVRSLDHLRAFRWADNEKRTVLK